LNGAWPITVGIKNMFGGGGFSVFEMDKKNRKSRAAHILCVVEGERKGREAQMTLIVGFRSDRSERKKNSREKWLRKKRRLAINTRDKKGRTKCSLSDRGGSGVM